MNPLWIAEFVITSLVAAWLFKERTSDASKASGDSITVQESRSNKWNLPDIAPSIQKGDFSGLYDEAFEKAAAATGVPFALIKAHAIRESSLDANAYHFDNNQVGASYGLMQVEWINGSNRFAKYGIDDSQIGADGSALYDETLNAFLGASIIKANLDWLGNLRDAINAYNIGTSESKKIAPHNYVDDVLGYYSKIIGGSVL